MTTSHSEPTKPTKISNPHNHIFMTLEDVMGYLRVKSSSTIYRWIKDKGFPKPLLSTGEEKGSTKRWDMAEVANWVSTSRQRN